MSTATEHQVIAIIPSLAHSTVPDGTGKYGKVTHIALYILLFLCIDIPPYVLLSSYILCTVFVLLFSDILLFLCIVNPCYNTLYVLLFSSVLLLEGNYSNSIRKLKINTVVGMYIFLTYGGNIRGYVGWLKGLKQQNGTDW